MPFLFKIVDRSAQLTSLPLLRVSPPRPDPCELRPSRLTTQWVLENFGSPQKCAQKEFHRANIVRDVRLRDQELPQGFEIESTGGVAVGPDSTRVNSIIRKPSPRLDDKSRSSTQNQ